MKTDPQIQSFSSRYISYILQNVDNELSDNHDWLRFGPEDSSQQAKACGPKCMIKSLLAGLNLMTTGTVAQRNATRFENLNQSLNYYTDITAELEWLNKLLQDENSRQTLCEVLAYRALGPKKIRLPLSKPDYWNRIRAVEFAAEPVDAASLGYAKQNVFKINLDKHGYPIEMVISPKGVVTQFILEQYRCVSDALDIGAKNGGVVLDCGGCYGDTALYFAHKVGVNGKVYSFEFVPDNLEKWHHNVSMNPELEKRIRLVNAPVWNVSNQTMFIEGTGPGTRVLDKPTDPNALAVQTISIDDLATKEHLESLDFIKMDIEGAELAALQGAESSIRRFRPDLAICVYHSLEDFWLIPQFIDSLNLGYRFYLRHFTIHSEETVIFATCR